MKSIGLIVCLFLTVGNLSYVHAVTNAELEALEKQIEQLEAEEKRQAEAAEKRKTDAEAKRKAEQKRKASAEAERKRLAEQEKQRIKEDEHLAEETKKRKEEEKKEKYTRLIDEAEQAVANKDKEMAISKYNEALTLYPVDPKASSGIQKAEQLMEKMCYEVLGVWEYDYFISHTITISEDGKVDGGGWEGWECTNPNERIIMIHGTALGITVKNNHQLNEKGGCLFNLKTSICYRRSDYSKSDDGKPKKSKSLSDAIQF